MSDFSELIEVIEQAIKTNNNEEITGAILQGVLKDIVEALGDEAINALETALQNEINTRTLADTALGGRIDDEATARSNADTALSNRLGSTITAENTAADQIGAEAEAREAADTALQGLIDGITDNIENGYVYAGIATPSTTPVTGKVFYLALQGGQYTHFGNTAVMQGINIFKYNGSSWLHDAYIGISDKPIPSDTGLVKAGGTFGFVMDNGSAFDISKHFASGSTLATYADLDAALTALDGLDEEYKRAGMSIKYVHTSDNKYVQYRLKAQTFTTDVTQWQDLNSVPEAKNNSSAPLDISDENGNVIVRFNGGIKTKDFDSTFEATTDKKGLMSPSDKTKLNGIEEGAEKNNIQIEDEEPDLSLSDDNNNVLVEFQDGHLRTKNFDSKKIIESVEEIRDNNFIEMYAYAEGDSANDDGTHFYGWKNHICAWQRAINACDGVTRTKIYCLGGIKVTDVADMFKYGNFWNVINIPNGKNNIELIGQGIDKTRVEVSLPNNLDINTYQYYQTMYINGNNCVIKDMTIALKNGRYPLHLDRSGGNTMNGYNVTFENCEFIHYPNELSGMWSDAPFGLGISSGMHLITKRCGFVAPTTPLYLHDNINHDEGFLWDIIDCYCNNFSTITALRGVFSIQLLGGGCNGVINVVNMDSESTPELYVIDQLNNSITAGKPKESYIANLFTRITGQSFNPIGYYVKNVDANGNLKDETLTYPNAGVLRIKSSSAGNSSSIRFNTTSSAFSVLVKGLNNLATDFTTPKSPIVYANGYVYRDGKTSSVLNVSGYAHGCLSIAKNSDVASLHARLGDCSITNLTLGVIVDGTEQTITFDQDYRAMSDADIIDAINAQLSGAVADIFIWGAEYYPEIKPSFHILTNKAKGVIPNGTVVSYKNGTIDIAESDDEIFGVAIDDIYYDCNGRVLTKCLLSTSESDRFRVNVTLTEGAYRYGIDINAGVLVAKANGVFTADYEGFLTLNK